MLFVPGVTILLSLSVFSLMIAECLPQTSEAIPLLGQVARRLVSVLVSLKKIPLMIETFFCHRPNYSEVKLMTQLCTNVHLHKLNSLAG